MELSEIIDNVTKTKQDYKNVLKKIEADDPSILSEKEVDIYKRLSIDILTVLKKHNLTLIKKIYKLLDSSENQNNAFDLIELYKKNKISIDYITDSLNAIEQLENK